ncbi:plant transposon protein [Nitzschia inconspicua]|uniref:Plant transposon protein n=1 Tax=Nitzschia inconspicua TaxID=303405 RepID=A0A9K3Q582_9STRA|nr:plant transposon protein [Nitzschia inconspicua]
MGDSEETSRAALFFDKDHDEECDDEDDEDDESDEDDLVVFAALNKAMNASANVAALKVDHRTRPRKKRKVFRHDRAYVCLLQDYLGPEATFAGSAFVQMFRITRARFERLYVDAISSGNQYYKADNRTNPATKMTIACVQARLLLPLKCLAYGVPSHTFCDYFQMSKTQARECCKKFNLLIPALYSKEYLRLPTKKDLVAINKLHSAVHKIDGMFGSLDCMHTTWKNCPVAWQGSFRGKSQQKSTIVLEAIADHHLFFWHLSYGWAGTLNDINILNQSPFLRSLTDGVFNELESDVVPYSIGDEIFDKMFVLVDGIYPRYSRFVKTLKQPVSQSEQRFAKWQEAARKDIERAFGVLQAKFQAVARPIHTLRLEEIGAMVTTCLVLHNICVSDRIMGDVHARYDPSYNLSVDETTYADTTQCRNTIEKQRPVDSNDVAVNGLANFNPVGARAIAQRSEFRKLEDRDEWNRLNTAILKLKGG